jgi:calcium-dependent protein kinase
LRALLVLVMQVISKRKVATADEVKDIQREVEILHHLKGHDNIVPLRDVFEDITHVYIVMDCCTGEGLW